MAVTLTPGDLEPFASISEGLALAMIKYAIAEAALVAPCIDGDELTDRQVDAAKSVILGAVLRWNDAKSGAVTTNQAGSFQQVIDSNTRRYGMFWPQEIRKLSNLCGQRSGRAFSIETLPIVESGS